MKSRIIRWLALSFLLFPLLVFSALTQLSKPGLGAQISTSFDSLHIRSV
jgi:hypothetical protein